MHLNGTAVFQTGQHTVCERVHRLVPTAVLPGGLGCFINIPKRVIFRTITLYNELLEFFFRQYMQPTLTFIIPVISKEITDRWDLVYANLKKTLASVENQTNSNWRVLIVSQTRPDVEYIEDRIIYVPAGFKPARKAPTNTKLSASDTALCRRVNDLDRLRKIRVAAATLHKYRTDFVMVLEADDFVSKRLCEFVSAHTEAHGWAIEQGYIWNGKSHYMHRTNRLTAVCGSSSIVKVFYELLPKEMPIDVDPSTLNLVPSGCPFLDHVHSEMRQSMAQAGRPIQTLPFRGAIYNRGHGLNLSLQYSNEDRYLPPLVRIRRWSRQFFFYPRRIKNRVYLTDSLRSEFAIGLYSDETSESESRI